MVITPLYVTCTLLFNSDETWCVVRRPLAVRHEKLSPTPLPGHVIFDVKVTEADLVQSASDLMSVLRGITADVEPNIVSAKEPTVTTSFQKNGVNHRAKRWCGSAGNQVPARPASRAHGRVETTEVGLVAARSRVSVSSDVAGAASTDRVWPALASTLTAANSAVPMLPPTKRVQSGR